MVVRIYGIMKRIAEVAGKRPHTKGEPMNEPIYRRVLLKISGEALAGENKFGFSDEMLLTVARQIKEIHDLGVEVAIVIGGGNFWRGRSSGTMDRAAADYIGMLATIMNSLALQNTLESMDVQTRVMTSIYMKEVAEPYTVRNANHQLKKGRVVIMGGGTGHPYFSTDTAAALRAAEVNADVILFAKKVDAVYSADPEVDPNAVKFDKLTHMEVLEKDLKVMDLTAASLCRDNDIAIHVFGLSEEGNIKKAVLGEPIGTIIS